MLLVVLATANGAVSQQMQTVLDEGFDAAPSAWATSVEGGALRVPSGLTLVPVFGVADADIEYRAKVDGEGLIECLFRHDIDSDDYYAFRIDTRTAGGNPPGFLKRSHTGVPWPLAGERFGSAPTGDVWVDVRVEIRGGIFQGYVDGDLVAALEDADFASGGFVFRSQVSEALIDDLVIRVPEGEPYTIFEPRPRREETPGPFTEGTWTGHWIWSPGTDTELTRVFRKRFDVPGKVYEGTLAVTCDNAYDLALNGQLLGHDEDWYSVEVYDIAPYLKPGANVLAARCENLEPGSAGLLIEAGITTRAGEFVGIASDGSWRVSKETPDDWAAPGLDDAAWQAAASVGEFPAMPWSGQRDLRLPFIGRKQPIKLVSARASSVIRPNDDIEIAATWLPVEALTDAYPVVVSISQDGRRPVDVAVIQPDLPATEWPVGVEHTETVRVPVRPDVGYLIEPGKAELSVELRGTFYPNRAGYKVGRARVAPAAAAAKATTPTPVAAAREGHFVDPVGGSHEWHVDGAGRVVVDGVAYIPLDADGVYWCDAASGEEALAAVDWRAVVEALCARGGPLGADFVRVRLVDHIDATLADHEFSDDAGLGGKSRVLHIGDRDYRVTSARDRLSYFAFTASCERPRNPHLMMFQSVNDMERYTTLRIQPPWDNVGGGVYTGREYPCDGQPFEHRFIFYPRDERVRFTVSRRPVETPITPDSGGAVSHVWLFELVDALSSRPVLASEPDRSPRRLGIYLTHPGYIYQLYGYRGDNAEERRASVRSFVDYLKFCGVNLLEFNAVDGGDTTGTAFYESDIWPRSAGNLLEELLPICAENDIQVIPIITSLSVPEGKFGFTRESMQMDRFGDLTTFFSTRPPLPDPLRPEVQDLLIRNLREILDICADNPVVPAVGFRVNGKIGLCYGGETLGKSDRYTGYSPWDIAEFEADTGVDVPEMAPTPYEWIAANCWEQWLDWRCGRTRDFWLRSRDEVRSYRDDLLLYVSCDMPSETPAWNVYWPEGETPLDCWRYHGVDPRMFADEPGILIQRGMMVAADRYFTGFGQYGRNIETMKTFHYAPETTALYAGSEGAACELYHNYWEEFGVFRAGEFQTEFWGAATMSAFGRNYFEPIAFSLARTNCHTLNLFSWERGTFGHEHDLRAFARAFRALPRGEGVDAADLIDDDANGLWVRRFDDRVAVLNNTGGPRTVTLRLPNALAKAHLIEFGRGEDLGVGTVTLPLAAYELRVVGPAKALR